MKPILLHGGIHADSRGILRYVNEEIPGNYRRFYLINPNDTNVVRAWQGHKQEEKCFYAINGCFIIAVVNPTCFEKPSEDEKPVFFQLTEENKSFLRVPGGSYTGIKSLGLNSTLLVLSTLDLAGSKTDDYRQPADKWEVDWNNLTPSLFPEEIG